MKMRAPGLPEKPWFLVAAASLIAGALLISTFLRAGGGDRSLLCSLTSSPASTGSITAGDLTAAILHCATSSITPQQSRAEIKLFHSVLCRRSPCNFRVFGLGHDLLMWHSFNLGGTTVFLEEDPKWVRSILKAAPMLRAFTVRYPTHLVEADRLLKSWRSVGECSPEHAKLKGNRRCRLALADLTDAVYENNWDVIMIDAPRGYYNEALKRMGLIYSAAVMARIRRAPGPTDVFLHDMDRTVERTFAMEFMCKRILVEETGRICHFQIPSVGVTRVRARSRSRAREVFAKFFFRKNKGVFC